MPDPKPDDRAKSTPVAPKVEKVILSNKLAQRITVSVENGNGPEAVALEPHGNAGPFDVKSLTPYTLGMIEKGHIRKRPA